jgi:hypothetical protein
MTTRMRQTPRQSNCIRTGTVHERQRSRSNIRHESDGTVFGHFYRDGRSHSLPRVGNPLGSAPKPIALCILPRFRASVVCVRVCALCAANRSKDRSRRINCGVVLLLAGNRSQQSNAVCGMAGHSNLGYIWNICSRSRFLRRPDSTRCYHDIHNLRIEAAPAIFITRSAVIDR